MKEIKAEKSLRFEVFREWNKELQSNKNYH